MSRNQSMSVGQHQIIAITDGEFEFGTELFPGTDEDHIKALLEKAGADAIRTNFNAFVIKSPNRTMLVDAGPRDMFGPTCGNLPEGLAEAGIAAQDITHVMLTHLHPDHIAGSITADGAAAFANATLLVSEEEHNFWTQDEAFGDENMDQWQQLAKAVMSAYGERVETFSANADLGHDMTAVALPGHTPGHSGFRVDDGNESLIMVCDIFHAPDLQLTDPEIAIAFDIDADTARQTRKRTLDMIATEGLTFTGGHMMSPKITQLERDGKGYRLASQ